MSHKLIEAVESKCLKRQVPEFHVGDTVDVATRIREGAKERTQTYNGVVIARRGSGFSASFTVRRIVNNEGVERKFLIHSPSVLDVRVKRRGKVRRAKLYFLRGRVGKARRLRELRTPKAKLEASPQPSPERADSQAELVVAS